MTTNRYYQGPPSDHFDGVRFFNPGLPSNARGLKDVLKWRLTGDRAKWPQEVPGRQVIPAARVEGLRVTMIGHASVLLQVAGLNILVDPVWSNRVSPFRWAGPRRVTPPGVVFDTLPPVDAVLLSHNHYDHLDTDTLQRVWSAHHPRVIAPLGNDVVVHARAPGIEVAAHDWGDTIQLGAGTRVTLCPANHWSARGLGDRWMALWCGYVIESPAGSLYVVGDTGYGDGRIFREVRQRFPALDVAVIPIGAYEPRWFMKDQHCDPDEAVQIMLDCGARHALGMHWGTFQLTDEPRAEPRERLATALGRRGLAAESFVAMEAGDVWSP